MRRAFSFCAAVLLLAAAPAGAAEADERVALDEKTLKDAGVPTDGPGLLKYLKAQTPSEADLARLAEAARRLGHRSFAVRERAQQALVEAGRPSLRYLRAARKDPDIEVARRAERAIEQIEAVPYVSVMSAVARLLGVRRPAGAAEALLAYLPGVTEESVEEAFLEGLAGAGLEKGKAAAALRAALSDREPARRAAAAYVHGRAKPPQLDPVRPLLRDADPAVRFRAAEALVFGRDKAGVPVLIILLGEVPGPRGWRVEDLLYRVAGETAPAVALGGGDEEARKRSREAWQAWWKKNGARVDLAKINLDDPLLGLTLYCEYDGNAGGGRVWLAGPDGKQRWEINGLSGPNDARLLPGGRVLIAERNASRVTERDQTGKVLWQQQVDGGAIAADRLPNGNTLVTTWNQIVEITPAGKRVWSTEQGGFRYAYRLRNGHVLGVTSGGQVVEYDARGKKLSTVTPARYASGAGYWATVERLPGGNSLLALGTSGKVVEVDAAGKVVWEADVSNVVYAMRLRNGHTLACDFEGKQVVELDRGGKPVARQTLTGRPFTVRRY